MRQTIKNAVTRHMALRCQPVQRIGHFVAQRDENGVRQTRRVLSEACD